MGLRKKKHPKTTIMINEKQFDELSNKLDILIKVTAASVFKDKPISDGILFLSDLGMQSSEIAKVLGTTPAYVNKVRYEAKKYKKKKEKTSEEETPNPTN
ncbi:MAG: hypothetical protein QXN36_00075 [Candidatus Bathyarchaeia archaeon]